MFYQQSDDDSYQGFTFLNQDVLCSFQDKSSIQRNWILLDRQSTVDVLSNSSLLTNIQDAKTDINSTLQCRKSIVTKKVTSRDTGRSCTNPNPKGIANILSLHKVQQKYKVTFDRSALVHKSDGMSRMFKPSKKGLFFSDV